MEKIIMHIDVNNAFLSWTAVDMLEKGAKVDIRETFAVIGGSKSRRAGIIVAKSTPCKKVGVKSGEPYFMARKKCPDFKIYKPDYKVYQKMSNSLFKLLSEYTPDIEVFSIDECFLDYGKVKRLYGDEIEFAYKIKDEIENKLGFTVNIGIGRNKLCAKMASDFEKPNRVHTLFENEIQTKMHPLPIEALFGVGKKSSAKLRSIGINTVKDLSVSSVDILSKYFKNQASHFIDLANGIDSGLVNSNIGTPKGVGISRTLVRDYDTEEELLEFVEAMADEVSFSLRKRKQFANVISVNLKNSDFKTYSHQRKLDNASNCSEEIIMEAKKLFIEVWNKEPIRLVGVSASELTKNPKKQLTLFEGQNQINKDSELDNLIDNMNKKFGKNKVKRASKKINRFEKKY